MSAASHEPAHRASFLRVLIAAFSLWSVGPGRSEEIVLHVAPQGRDEWSGRVPAPTPDGSDGPLASLHGAQRRWRELRRAATAAPPRITVQVHEGTYELRAPLVLEPEDSGQSNAPLTIAAAPATRPVLSGGVRLGAPSVEGDWWVWDLPEVREGRWYFQQVFVNGQRRPRARSPNQGWHRFAALVTGPPPRPNTVRAVWHDRFMVHPGDLGSWTGSPDAVVVLFHSWENSIHPVRAVVLESNLVVLSAPMKEWWGLGYWEEHARYRLENAREWLDEPGEWYLDRTTGRLYYWPLAGETPGLVSVIAPRCTEFIRFAGDPDRGVWVSDIVIRGLTFHHADWVLRPEGNSSTQAAVEVPATITGDGAIRCVLERCEVAHIGTYAIWLRRGCRSCVVRQCRLFDLGAGGVRIGEERMATNDEAESRANVVDNNHIYEGGRIYTGAVGIWVAQSSHNVLSHNDIHDFFYTGISVGWNWDTAPNRCHHNRIEYNHVHDLGHGVMSDMGAIYCLGVSPGSVIRRNVLHDVWPYETPGYGWGIYLDAQCGGYTVAENLVYNTRNGGLMFNNGGHGHVITNNIFAWSAYEAIWPYSSEQPNVVRRNIVLVSQGRLFVPFGERTLRERLRAGASPGDWDENLYWHVGGPERLRFYRYDFTRWQALGLDRHSRVADPRFRDALGHDFHLQSDSPALELGFLPWEYLEAGLYGEPGWVEEAHHRRCRPRPLPRIPSPPPLRLEDDFESTEVGQHPRHAVVSGEETGASIRVTDERAASGRHSLRVTDRRTLQPSWQPHFYYSPLVVTGRLEHAFDVWLEPDAEFIVEWRDEGEYPDNVGPSVHVRPGGAVLVAGRELTRLPIAQWSRLILDAPVGVAHAKFQLTVVTPEGRQVFSDLPMRGQDFREVHWLGFASVAAGDTAFYLDNLIIRPGPAGPEAPSGSPSPTAERNGHVP